MAVSVFDLFKIGIGPSSSHTVGPMRAAHAFVQRLQRQGMLAQVARLRCQLFGSLGATGIGHASDRAVMLGLAGHAPDTVDVNAVDAIVAQIHSAHQLLLNGEHTIVFEPATDLLLIGDVSLPFHPNGMRLIAFDEEGTELVNRAYYSVGGGFVVNEEAAGANRRANFRVPCALLASNRHRIAWRDLLTTGVAFEKIVVSQRESLFQMIPQLPGDRCLNAKIPPLVIESIPSQLSLLCF